LASTLSATANPEQVKGISTRGGKSTRDPPYPKGARRPPQLEQVEKEVERDNTEKLYHNICHKTQSYAKTFKTQISYRFYIEIEGPKHMNNLISL
jgi:hypothetical protein